MIPKEDIEKRLKEAASYLYSERKKQKTIDSIDVYEGKDILSFKLSNGMCIGIEKFREAFYMELTEVKMKCNITYNGKLLTTEEKERFWKTIYKDYDGEMELQKLWETYKKNRKIK